MCTLPSLQARKVSSGGTGREVEQRPDTREASGRGREQVPGVAGTVGRDRVQGLQAWGRQVGGAKWGPGIEGAGGSGGGQVVKGGQAT